MPKLIGEAKTKVTVIAMVEDGFSYCNDYCRKETCRDCSHRDQKCGFPVTFKLKPIEKGKEHLVPKPEQYCGDKPEDYIPTLVTFEQRYDSILQWLAERGYSYNPSAHMKLNKPNGYPATFQNLLEELHNWLLFNRGHTGVDDYIIAISKINFGASLRFIGSFIGSEKSGLIGRMCEREALRKDLPNKVTVREAKKLGYTKTNLLQMGYVEKRENGRRFMVRF